MLSCTIDHWSHPVRKGCQRRAVAAEQEATMFMGPTYEAVPRVCFHRGPGGAAWLEAVLVHEHVDALVSPLSPATLAHEELVQAIYEQLLLLARMAEEHMAHAFRASGAQCTGHVRRTDVGQACAVAALGYHSQGIVRGCLEQVLDEGTSDSSTAQQLKTLRRGVLAGCRPAAGYLPVGCRPPDAITLLCLSVVQKPACCNGPAKKGRNITCTPTPSSHCLLNTLPIPRAC
jgi:hypothetical protein